MPPTLPTICIPTCLPKAQPLHTHTNIPPLSFASNNCNIHYKHTECV